MALAVPAFVAGWVLAGFAEPWPLVASGLRVVSLALIPLAAGLAITRFHLYDVDRVISRTTAYALVTGVLLGVYVVVVTSLTSLVPDSGSSGATDSWAVAIATLAAAALFRPVLRVGSGVWWIVASTASSTTPEVAVEVFAREMRDEVEPEHVKGSLLGRCEPDCAAVGSCALAAGRASMKRSEVLRVVWWVMVVTAAVGVVSSVLTFREMQNPFLVLPIAAEAVVGASLARQRPGNPMGWIFLGIGALAGLLSLAIAITSLATRVPGDLPWWGLAAAWIASWVWYPLVFLLTTLTLLLFPSGLHSTRWRPVLWLSTLSVVGMTMVAMLVPTIGVEFSSAGEVTRSVSNPLSPPFMASAASVEDSPAGWRSSACCSSRGWWHPCSHRPCVSSGRKGSNANRCGGSDSPLP